MTGRANLVMVIGTSIMTVVKGQYNPFLHVWNREMDLGMGRLQYSGESFGSITRESMIQ